MKKHWYELVKARLEALKMSQAELSERMGVTPGAIGHWLNERRQPSISEIGTMFNILGISGVTFNPDGTFSLGEDQPAKPPKPQYEYPLFSTVQAGEFAEVGTYTEADAQAWVPTTKNASSKSFWLEVSGHSMTAPQGVRPSFPEGILILIDPAEDVNPGDFCVASINGGEDVTFKKLERDAGINYLVPLNPKYRTLECDATCRIVGKAVKAQWPDEEFL